MGYEMFNSIKEKYNTYSIKITVRRYISSCTCEMKYNSMLPLFEHKHVKICVHIYKEIRK